ncbi:hypothetical protein Zmor_002694 [Zophobas morio]|uniref:Uncharacterized protein n=1 Tax=Zophobas morio TaxID=2755281 RepID=A0AA38HQG7_9CUCU|nr:hypothetical protein Zmor_002694 [Zophobas morio]
MYKKAAGWASVSRFLTFPPWLTYVPSIEPGVRNKDAIESMIALISINRLFTIARRVNVASRTELEKRRRFRARKICELVDFGSARADLYMSFL